ncbi:flagellar basal-body rod modification protein FlgD [Quadrisphaera granulorum]|uniref:Flagellar basal-body rod modification protein FlgD n=1 Tax=Quadrisphaera granulorum TaxID=317664 RepID=A0A316A5T5_9ACTN|nr:flagellar hook capping FlgD N-terminal domain-containing protein [Quadrisphaera granulorum]PWJ52588.1 flagellar basal-body rod modification protein FlgD [Quadrisphaera granulorum]SZE97638.1 flagellar basal-body rod modification protein FlgD [Quadrisphaera granulorum]
MTDVSSITAAQNAALAKQRALINDNAAKASQTPSSVAVNSRNGTAVVAQDKTSLGKDQFLQLLVTQMRYQDPSSPMDSNQVMAQTAQLSTVEQLTELATTQREAFGLQMRLSASSFVGKQVEWKDADGVKQSGVVDSADFSDATPQLVIGDKKVPIDQIITVKPAATSTTPTTTTSGSGTTGASGSSDSSDKK